MRREESGDDLLQIRTAEAVRMARERHQTRFLPFLTPAQGAMLHNFLAGQKFSGYRFWGGYENAERCMLGIFHERAELEPAEFPICCIKLLSREMDRLTHRDLLGATMAAGVKREMVGDIVLEANQAFLFAAQSVASFLLQNLEKAGNVGLRAELLEALPELQRVQEFQELSTVIASPRLDCVVGGLLGMGRAQAAAMIEGGFVSVNWSETEKVAAQIKEGDTLSIQKKGRFVVDSLSGVTKKGRTVLKARKYL